MAGPALYPTRRDRGFTLIELLVVIAIIAILIGLLIPAVQKVQEAAARAKCQNNLKQVATAMHNYQSQVGTLPFGVSNVSSYWGHGTWQVLILPYIEQQAIFEMYQGLDSSGPLYHDNENVLGPSGAGGATTQQIATLLCPSDTKKPRTEGWTGNSSPASPLTYHNYVVNFGNTGITETIDWQAQTFNGIDFKGAPFTRGRQIAVQNIQDGSSNTLMASELIIGVKTGSRDDLRGLTWWGTGSGFETSLRPNDTAPDLSWASSAFCNPEPPNPPCSFRTDTYQFGARSRHPMGVNVVMCDGSGRFVRNSIDADTWMALGTTTGGESLGDY